MYLILEEDEEEKSHEPLHILIGKNPENTFKFKGLFKRHLFS